MQKILTPFRVGLLVLAAGSLLIVAIFSVRKGGLSDSDSIEVFAYFRDASGLGTKTRVQIAGIQVGEVTAIKLEGQRARVSLRVQTSVGLRTDAILSKRSESFLGDYVLDLAPGSEGAERMPDGGEIRRVVDTQGMEQVFEKLNRITGDISEVTTALRNVLGGDRGTGSLERIVENLIRLSETVDSTVGGSGEKLQAILENFEAFSEDVRRLSDAQDDRIRSIVGNVDYITRDVREMVTTVKGIVGSNQGELKDSVASLKQTIDRLDRSLANVEEVTQKVKEGKGTVGTLLADERLGQKISESVEDLSDFTTRVTQLKTEVGIKSEYLTAQGTSKNSLGIRLIPRPDKYYLLEFVDDPRGVVETQVVQNNPPASGQPVTQVQKITKDSIKFSAQFAKRYYFATARFGIIESTGGIGGDLNFVGDQLQLKLDAFNFSVEELRYPRLRATLRANLLRHLFVTVGMDDMLNRQVRDSATNRLIAGRDFFFGGGVFFTDDDLKAILTAAPVRVQ